MLKTKFLVCDGMDGCGKSTLLHDLARDFWPRARKIEFPKTLPSGALLRMNTERDFEILFTMFDLLSTGTTYLLDRFIVSNLVYDKILRNESTEISRKYYAEFKRRFNVLEIFLTRPKITSEFIDDRIKITVDQFNAGIDEYRLYGPNYQIITRSESGELEKPTPVRDQIYQKCGEFIHTHI